MIQEFDLRDVHAFNHGYDDDIATYFRCSCRLDYVFVSCRIIDHVFCCGYEPFKARFPTNHRAYFVDFSIAGLFDRRLPILFSPSQRHISGNHPKNIRKYIIFLFNYIQEQNLLKKACECQHKVYFSPELAEEIDEILTAGMIAAEKQCQVSYCLPWDKETDAVMTAYNIVQTHLSCLLCN